jgi:hypothetical protein
MSKLCSRCAKSPQTVQVNEKRNSGRFLFFILFFGTIVGVQKMVDALKQRKGK